MMMRVQLVRRSLALSRRHMSATAGVDRWGALETKANGVVDGLVAQDDTVGVAETTSGGLICAALFSHPDGSRAFKGGGLRLAYGIDRAADEAGVEAARTQAVGMIELEYDGEPTESGTAVHALELANAARLNLGTTWGVGESSVPGPQPHRRTGSPPGEGFVAVAGPTAATTGVLRLQPGHYDRSENMFRFATGALDLLALLQKKR